MENFLFIVIKQDLKDGKIFCLRPKIYNQKQATVVRVSYTIFTSRYLDIIQ